MVHLVLAPRVLRDTSTPCPVLTHVLVVVLGLEAAEPERDTKHEEERTGGNGYVAIEAFHAGEWIVEVELGRFSTHGRPGERRAGLTI